MIKLLRIVLVGIVLSAAFFSVASASGVDVNATSTGLAMRGFDPVSYFADGEPKAGEINITAVHKGATYRFASDANKAKFEADPEAYAPAYGGYCAFGTAMGFKFDGDPAVWKIVDNKLYLNLSKAVQKRWVSEEPEFIQQADANWVKIEDQSPDSLQN